MHIILAALLLTIPASLIAEELDSASKEALEKTQELLKSPEQRQKYTDENSDARKADAKLDELTGSKKHKNEVYDISSAIFADVVKDSGGNVDKQKELLERAAKDPEAFFKSLSPAQRARIRDLASQIQKENPRPSPRD